MAARQLRIGWNVPGTFTRLGLHMGAILAWMHYGLPKPTLVVATSAGAIITACCISFEREILRTVAHVVGNLKRNQIFTLSPSMNNLGLHLIVAPCVLLAFSALAVHIAAKFSNSWLAWFFLACGTGAFLWIVYRAAGLFPKAGSPFDTAPLRNLLLNKIHFEHLFKAQTELLILATDVVKPGACVFSNHGDKTDPDIEQYRERFVDVIRCSANLPGRFPIIFVDKKNLRDGEIWTDYPVHQFWDSEKGESKVDIIFRLDYWSALQPVDDPGPTSWPMDLHRCFDIMRDKMTLLKMQEYEHEREKNPRLPKVVMVRASAHLFQQIPDLAVYGFQKKQLWKSIGLGYRIIRENLPMIRRELGLDQNEEVA